MNKKYCSFFTILGMAVVLIGLTSCNNFLKGADLRDQLESTIAYANAPTYKIIVEADKDCGQLKKPITGEINQKVSDVFEIKFEPVTDYTFMRWEASSEYLPEGESIKDYIEFEEPGNPETKVHFKKALNSIVITAVCPHLPYVDFTLTSTNYTFVDLKGDFNPSVGIHRCTDTHTYTLSYDPFTDWEFVRWEIYDARTKQVIPNDTYIHIENPQSKSTIYSFVEAPVDQEIQIAIRPIIAERPQVISYAPMGSNINKDTAIQVLFDREIDPSCIYYTKEEMDEMIANGVADSPLYQGTVDGKTIYKGYKKGNKNFYKNIMIINQRNNENINHYFLSPYIEKGTTLIIPADKNMNGYLQILVTIERGICSKEAKTAQMAGSKKWTYLTNNKVDDRPIFIVKDEEHPYEAKYSQDGEDLPIETPADIDPVNGDGIQTLNFINDSSIYLKVRLHKNTTGGTLEQQKFNICTQKLYDANYDSVNQAVVKTAVDYTSNDGYDADFEGNISLPDADGVYSIYFEFKDSAGHTITYPEEQKYYVTKDTSHVSEITDLTVNYNKTNGKVTLAWTNQNPCKDIYYEVQRTDLQNNTTNETLYIGESPNPSIVLTAGDLSSDRYSYSITAFERCGNQSQTVTKKVYPILAKDFVYVEGMAKKITDSYTPSSNVLITNRTISIPNMLVCDHEVTQKEFTQYMMLHNSTTFDKGTGDDYPAYYVNWFDTIIYCNLRSKAEGLTPVYSYKKGNDNNSSTNVDDWVDDNYIYERNGKYFSKWRFYYDYNNLTINKAANGYRLPEEVEWEYIARGGNNTQTFTYSGDNDSNEVGWYYGNSSVNGTRTTHPVKSKKANTLGIYDMTGNVAEYCFDDYKMSLGSSTPSPVVNIDSPGKKIIRGGNFIDPVHSVADRIDTFDTRDNPKNTNGFRVVRTFFDTIE